MKYNIIISIIIIIAGIGLIFKVLYVYYFYTVTLKKWSIVKGEILESGVEYFRSKTDSDTEGWRQKIVYTYDIEGVTYTNDKMTKNIGILLPSESSAKKNSVDYIVGQKVNIHYNKRNPQESIIDDSFNYSSLFLILISILSFFVANYIKNELW